MGLGDKSGLSEVPMNKFLNDIRSAENSISGNQKIINTIWFLHFYLI